MTGKNREIPFKILKGAKIAFFNRNNRARKQQCWKEIITNLEFYTQNSVNNEEIKVFQANKNRS